MKDSKRFTVTAALPYANGPVHIGHLAGVYVPADIYVRYLRAKKKDVVFVCGSDEHGVPITIRADKEGLTPQQIVDRYHGIIKDSFKKFGISFDIYSRTSSDVHAETASQFFKDLYDKGEFIEQVSEQFYDEKNNQFLADRYIKGECPKCGNPEAYGDQCEKCGSTLSSDELINPKSALSGEVPVKKSTKHWYLPLDKYEEDLKKWILEDHKDWKSNVYGQCKSWLDQGLQPRAVTRDLDWGVPVPVEGAEGKVLYVWFDAPIGYISATKEWAKQNNQDWAPYWKDQDTSLVHFIGKDNIVFHCIVFPAMIKAQGEFILPENVPANEFLNLEGDKISTSRNWAVWLHEYLEDFPGKQDILRYMLCANAPETKDNDFTWKDFQTRNNSELVAILGNFINRALVLTQKYYAGKVPNLGSLEPIDEDLMKTIKLIPSKVEKSIEAYKFRDALNNFMELARAGNKYLADCEPWKVQKENPERVETVMNLALQIVANISILSKPFLPFTSDKIRSSLNIDILDWDRLGDFDLLKVGHVTNKPELLFAKIEDAEVELQIKKLEDTKRTNANESIAVNEIEEEPISDEIEFPDFSKCDFRIGEIKTAEKVKKADKLLNLTVDLGFEQRTILSGIAEHFTADEVVGKQVIVVANLKPRKMRGIESQGMIMMGEDAKGKLVFVSPESQLPNGSKVM